MKSKTIVIDREYGSGGREVAKIISEKMNIEFYDRDLLALAAERYDIDLGIMKDYDEKNVGSLLYNIAMAANSIANYEKMEIPYRVYNAQAELIKLLATEKQCIILGRCADEILKDIVPIVHVFIYCDKMQQKINRIRTVDGIQRKNIEDYIHKKDAQRRNYYQYFTEKKWGEKSNYDICINTASLGFESSRYNNFSSM